MDALKRIEKIIRENAFEQKKKKLRLKFNPGLALIGLQTTGPRSLPKNESKTKNIQWSLHSQDTYQTRVGVPGKGGVLSTETHDWYKNYTVASSPKGHLKDQDRYALSLRGVPLIEITDTKFKQWSFYPGYFDVSTKGVS